MPTPALAMRELRVSYGRQEVLHGVSLELPRGYNVVVGPSGSGKTTLLRAIAGLVDYEGSVEIAGRPVDHLPPWERGVALVQQIPGLLPHLSILDNVALAAVERRGLGWSEAREAARRLLGELGLSGLEDRKPGELSGGQLQRAAIAAALATGAEIMLLDEPLSHLDRLTAERLRELLMGLREKGATVVHVTHDLDEALVLGTYMAVLHGGRVITAGRAEDVYRCPGSREAAELLGHSVIRGEELGLGPGLYSLPPDMVGARPGRGEWRLVRAERERGRARLVLRRGGAVLYAYVHVAELPRFVKEEQVEPVILGEPCRLAG